MILKTTLMIQLLSTLMLSAAPMKLSPSQFSSLDFKKRFVGSYGMLPAVEPKVDSEEAALIADLGELMGKGQFRTAEKNLLAFIKERKNPTDPEKESKDVSAALIFVLGNLYFQNDRIKDAERAYQLAIKRHPDYRRAHNNLALLLATQDRIADAKPHLMKAIELGEASHRTYGLLGFALMKEEKLLVAEQAYRHANLLKPDEKDWKLGLTQVLLMQEKWVEAASMLQGLIDDSPEKALFWKQQANCFIQLDKMNRAAENYEALRLMGLADVEALNQLGDIYANQEQPLLALGSYLSATKLSDTLDVDRALKSARYLESLGASDEAQKLLADLRTHDTPLTVPQNIAVFLIESDLHRASDSLERAVEVLQKILKLEPTHGGARVRLGQIYSIWAGEADDDEVARKHRAEARQSFRLALNSKDEKVAYQANLRYGQALVRDRLYTDALPKLEAALRLKKSQNLEQYVRRVQRAAESQTKREEREALEQEERRQEMQKAQEKEENETKTAE